QIGTGSQKVTLQFCQASGLNSVQALIWQYAGSPSAYYGSVTPADGPATGTLNVQAPSATSPSEYLTVAGQASQFDLKAATPSSMMYSISGGSQVSVPTLNCST